MAVLGRTTARFWVCLGLLLAAFVGFRAAETQLKLFFRKEAVPLKRDLRLFDYDQLGPRYVLDRARTERIPAMSEDSIESLGTDQYTQVVIMDRQVPATAQTRLALLFITYYTGTPDPVPHVPEECYLAGGYDPISSETEPIPVPNVDAPGDKLPVRVLEFRARPQGALARGGQPVATVMYFFHANGAYVTSRSGVRTSMSNPFQRYAYYAKIEIRFMGVDDVPASKADSVAALGPLLERVMPVLLTDHFDLEKLEGAARVASSAEKVRG